MDWLVLMAAWLAGWGYKLCVRRNVATINVRQVNWSGGGDCEGKLIMWKLSPVNYMVINAPRHVFYRHGRERKRL